jgi:3-hydroxymyristoyl/3-hydroxydecanoyl-(acyl carrier protein) dehydratase
LRFLFIDRIISFEQGKSAVGIKSVTMSEDFLADHFPSFPIMPGVLQVEAISQLASWLVYATKDYSVKGITTEIDKVKFKDPVKPGDQMTIEVNIISWDVDGVSFRGNTKVNGKTKTVIDSGKLHFIPIEKLEDPRETREHFSVLIREKPRGIFSP